MAYRARQRSSGPMSRAAGTRSDLKRRLPFLLSLPSRATTPEFAFLVFDLTDFAGQRRRLPPGIGDEVAIVLHGLGPVVHEVLIHIVGVEQRRGLEGGEQGLSAMVSISAFGWLALSGVEGPCLGEAL